MSTIKVGINGLGRIGRTILRNIITRNEDDIEVTGINNPGDMNIFKTLLKYDSVHGRFEGDVDVDGDTLKIGGRTIKFFTAMDPTEIDWSSLGTQIVIDSTGVFKDKEGLGRHLGGTVKKVIMCAPGKDLDGTFVMGINHENYDPNSHHIISNASCTTNCLSPLAKVLNEKWGIENGFMTTIHAYTSDQKILDSQHSDIRRARAAGLSMIPTTTGAAKAVGLVIPELKGKLDGYAIRVPTPNVSMVDLSANLKATVTAEEINAAMKEASESNLKGILGYTEEKLVSVDYMGMRESSCVDASLTNVIGNTVKVVSWYDNEAGFSHRVIDLAKFIGGKL
ncbi:MAG: type I glyceraldehyde-3-phosphate dehydrogenase [Bacteriovoracaceae bacterium]